MFDTVSISELQKSLSKIFEMTKGYRYVLGNNKKRGMIVGRPFMEYLEGSGIIEEYEDAMLLRQGEEAIEEGRRILESNDFSECLTPDEICRSK